MCRSRSIRPSTIGHDAPVTTEALDALAAAYWDNFLNESASSLGRDWTRLDEADGIFESGGQPAIDLLLRLIVTAPRDRDGWLSYLLVGPIELMWQRDTDQRRLVEASAQSGELAEALSYLEPGGGLRRH
jgi:hypothetical protein